jgi:hypothetical protein
MPAPPLEEPGDWVCPEPAGVVATPVPELVAELVTGPGAPDAAGEAALGCGVLDGVVPATDAFWTGVVLSTVVGVWVEDAEPVCGSVLVDRAAADNVL